MPAASVGDRRVKPRARAKTPDDRARIRASRSTPPAASKPKPVRDRSAKAPLAAGVGVVIVLLFVVAALSMGGRGDQALRAAQRVGLGGSRLWAAGRELLDDHFADFGFRVASVRLSGASPASRDLILSAAAIKPGEPILGLDLDAVRARIERIGWVAHARVMRLLPDTLAISVDERHLMALWQHGGRRDVVTTDGTVVAGLDPRQYPDLPLVVGDGANGTAAAMITGLKAWPGLRARLWALRRVDDRRWDLILKDGSVVMLPDTDEAGALKRLDRLQSASKILDQGLSRIDLRDGDFVVVRPRAGAPTVASRGV